MAQSSPSGVDGHGLARPASDAGAAGSDPGATARAVHTPLRITMVISSLGMGGAERVFARIAGTLADRGHAVTVVTVADRGPDFVRLSPSVRRLRLGLARDSHGALTGLRNTLWRVRVLRGALRAARPDAVVSFIDVTNTLVLLALVGLRVPAIVAERVDPAGHPLGRSWRLLRRLAYRRAAVIVAQTAEAGAWIRRHLAPRTPVVVIPNGIDSPGRVGAHVSRAGGSRNVIAVGRLTPQKGIDLLLEAFARCAGRFPAWRLTIAGDGPERGALEAQAAALGLNGRISFLGAVSDVSRVLARSDIFVLPSRYEGFPNALLEAMAYGLPVIATDCGSGPREIVRDGSDGVLVPANDVSALADALGALMDDPAQRAALGSKAREITARFDWTDVMNRWEATLQQILRTGAAASAADEGPRFAFGRNWQRYARGLDDARIRAAEQSLREYLGVDDLHGKSFLDIGSGSGLFSLAARRLGARVHAFDYDPDSVVCARELRERYAPGDLDWRIEQGSVLDEPYVRALGEWDIVYSWGVLHHTGEMWRAIDLASSRVAPGGKLFIAIYNDQGRASRYWTAIKKGYNRAPAPGRLMLVAAVGGYTAARSAVGSLLWRLVGRRPVPTVVERRGMSRWYDLVDWVGGYPFEVAKPEEVFDFCRSRGFVLLRLRTCGGGLGCNQFVFERPAASAAPPMQA